MEIAQPWFLCLLLLLPLLALPLRRSLAALSRRRHAASLTLRALLLGLLVLALAGVRVRWPSRELAVVYVVDDSASISPAARESARAWIA